MTRCPILLLAAAGVLYAQVEGKVTSSVTGQPVTRAVVSLHGVPASATPPENYLCQTGADGRFSVKDAAPGIYEANASRAGFQNSAAESAVRITVAAGTPVANLNIRLIPLGAVAGRVVDENGDPVVKATVTAMRYKILTGKRELRPIHSSSTDDRGEYRIAVLPPGRWYLRVTKPDQDPPIVGGIEYRGPARQRTYATTFYPATPEPTRAIPLDIAPGSDLEHLDIHMPHVGVYSINITRPANGGIQVVRRNAAPFGAYLTMLRAGDEQYARISGLPPGTYTVIAETTAAGGRSSAAVPFAQQRVQIVDHDIEGVDLTHSTVVEMAGIVQGASAPLGVVLQTEEGSSSLQVEYATNTDGTFKLFAHPDAYYLTVQAPEGTYVKSMRIGDLERPDHRISPGRDTGVVTVVVGTDTGKVEGTVIDAQGNPAAKSMVTLIPDQKLPFWLDLYKTVTTDARGRFFIPAVVPGNYQVYAWSDNDTEPPMDPDFRKPYDAQSVNVHVPAGSTVQAALTVIAPTGNAGRNR